MINKQGGEADWVMLQQSDGGAICWKTMSWSHRLTAPVHRFGQVKKNTVPLPECFAPLPKERMGCPPDPMWQYGVNVYVQADGGETNRKQRPCAAEQHPISADAAGFGSGALLRQLQAPRATFCATIRQLLQHRQHYGAAKMKFLRSSLSPSWLKMPISSSTGDLFCLI